MKNLKYACKVENIFIRRALAQMIKESGIKIDCGFLEEHCIKNVKSLPILALCGRDGRDCGAGFARRDYAEECNLKLVSIEEIVEIIENYSGNTFKLNDEYTIELQDNGDIKVGCQTIKANTMNDFIKWYKEKVS